MNYELKSLSAEEDEDEVNQGAILRTHFGSEDFLFLEVII